MKSQNFGKPTNGAGGRFDSSTSCGIAAQRSAHCPRWVEATGAGAGSAHAAVDACKARTARITARGRLRMEFGRIELNILEPVSTQDTTRNDTRLVTLHRQHRPPHRQDGATSVADADTLCIGLQHFQKTKDAGTSIISFPTIWNRLRPHGLRADDDVAHRLIPPAKHDAACTVDAKMRGYCENDGSAALRACGERVLTKASIRLDNMVVNDLTLSLSGFCKEIRRSRSPRGLST